MKQAKYDSLREHYPEYISLEQARAICKIAKPSVLYLIKAGIIPAIDTGKITWRYKIALEDVITYLRRREQVGSMIPHGTATAGRKSKSAKATYRKKFSYLLNPELDADKAEYFKYIFADCDDVFTTSSFADLTGIHISTVLKLLRTGDIKYIADSPQYLIPKQYLLDFVVSNRFIEINADTEHYRNLLGGFEIWKNAKS